MDMASDGLNILNLCPFDKLHPKNPLSEILGGEAMKLRVIEQGKDRFLLCPNGSILKADNEVLNHLLTGFKRAKSFKGDDGYWIAGNATMEDVAGVTLAYVDDSNKLIILSDKLFTPEKQTEYISATEYAELHNKCRASVKNMCVAGRIPGAEKTSLGWMIPKDAPYPERKSRSVK